MGGAGFAGDLDVGDLGFGADAGFDDVAEARKKRGVVGVGDVERFARAVAGGAAAGLAEKGGDGERFAAGEGGHGAGGLEQAYAEKTLADGDTLNQKKVWIYQPGAGAGFKLGSSFYVDYAFTNLANQSNPLYTHIVSLRLDLTKPNNQKKNSK